VITRPFDVFAFEGLIGRLLLVGLRTSEVCLVSGLSVWVIDADGAFTHWLLAIGLMALMTVPVLRIVLTVVEALRMKDGLFVVTTVAVSIILGLTIAYALSVT